MAFKVNKGASISYDDPVALFNDLRTRKVAGLLSHQADVLRDYVKTAENYPDIAIQLPTGSGKTLVGLLIAEWRRRKFQERVVYLCPTRQLVNQVAAQAQKQYGIRAHSFNGSKKEFDQQNSGEYLNAESIAIAPYSALFNINPFFNSAQTIVLDDAHSAENYISAMWSLHVERFKSDHQALFNSILVILKKSLGHADWARFAEQHDELRDRGWVEKIPTPTFLQLIGELVPTIDAHVKNTSLTYSWGLIRGQLHACHLYISTADILIRPLLPPTEQHAPFNGARQRVYMSATLGEGGELERLSGRSKIRRMKALPDWDKQGIGRRLFFFPERSLKEIEVESLTHKLIQQAGRALMLVPDNRRETFVRQNIQQSLGIPTFNADDIEASKEPFTSLNKAAAVVANRYDGIDFPGDECRLTIVAGLPRGTNLQERFFIERMGAGALYDDRILTRIVQAVGRCTRSPTDYAAVVISGNELYRYLMRIEQREFLHPELQAELGFGIEQSKDVKETEFVENFRIFLEQGEDWLEADAEIVRRRENLKQSKLPCTAELQAAVQYEIEYQRALLRQDYEGALAAARTILGGLSDDKLRGYRAMWSYLAGAAAWQAHAAGLVRMEVVAREYFAMAMKAAIGVTWLAKFARVQGIQSLPSDEGAGPLIDRLETTIVSYGTDHDQRLEREEKFILENISSSESKKFEPGHERLGKLLGFNAGNKNTSGAPDPWWIVNEELCFVFEDHSDGLVGGTVSVNKARQAVTHPTWIKANLKVSKDAKVIPVLITPATKVENDAIPHLEGVLIWKLEDFREWAKNALAAVREARKTFSGTGDLAWRAAALSLYSQNNISPTKLLEMLKKAQAEKALSPIVQKADK